MLWLDITKFIVFPKQRNKHRPRGHMVDQGTLCWLRLEVACRCFSCSSQAWLFKLQSVAVLFFRVFFSSVKYGSYYINMEDITWCGSNPDVSSGSPSAWRGHTFLLQHKLQSVLLMLSCQHDLKIMTPSWTQGTLNGGWHLWWQAELKVTLHAERRWARSPPSALYEHHCRKKGPHFHAGEMTHHGSRVRLCTSEPTRSSRCLRFIATGE